MAWLEVHQTLKDHRKTYDAADQLEVEPVTLMGMMISFWLWALDNVPSGDITEIKPNTIARAAQWKGDPDHFIEVLESAGWLDRTEETLEIHDWYDYAGKLIDRREVERKRSKKRRAEAAKKKEQPEDDRRTTAGRPPDDQETTEGTVQYTTEQYTTEPKEDTPLTPQEGKEEPAKAQKSDAVPYEQIKELYNSICVSLPKIMNIEGARRKAVGARWKTYKTLETFEELFRKTEASDFMKGNNERNWTADFDWIMRPTNMAKVMEGKYDNKGGQGNAINNGHSNDWNTPAEETKLTGFKPAE